MMVFACLLALGVVSIFLLALATLVGILAAMLDP